MSGWPPAEANQPTPHAPPAAPVPVPRSEQTGPMDQGEALQTAQALLGPLPGFRKVGVKATRRSQLLVRFDLPEVAQHRYAGQLAHLETQTGWHVHIHPTTRQDALMEAARRVLPTGLTCNAGPSIYQNDHIVIITCSGTTSREAIAAAQHRFTEETGWQLELVVPALESTTETLPRLSQSEALARATSVLGAATDLYRISADAKRGILWLHFHFPTVAQQQYGERLTLLAAETGWRVEVHPRVHQKAVIEAARRLLPAHVAVVGKASLYQEHSEVQLACQGRLSVVDKADVQRSFLVETGWHLDLQVVEEEAHAETASGKTRTEEAEVVAALYRLLGKAVKRVSVDVVREILLVSVHNAETVCEQDAVQLAKLERCTGWHIEIVAAMR
jgi:hypothetical protein